MRYWSTLEVLGRNRFNTLLGNLRAHDLLGFIMLLFGELNRPTLKVDEAVVQLDLSDGDLIHLMASTKALVICEDICFIKTHWSSRIEDSARNRLFSGFQRNPENQ